MAEKLKDALDKNRVAAEDLNAALRDCLAALRDRPETVVEGRFKVVTGGRRNRG